MKVLHVAPSLSPRWGGPVAMIAGLTSALQARGVICTVMATTGHRVGDDQLDIDGVEIWPFPTGPLAGTWTGYAPGLARQLQRVAPEYDLVHIHELWHYPHYAAYRAARQSGRPYCVTVHGALSPWALRQKRLQKRTYLLAVQRRILERAAALHAVTEEEREHIQRQGFRVPAAVIPNGIDPEAFKDLPPPACFLERHPNLAGKRLVLFLGRIHPGKGLDILAGAFGEIARTRKDVALVIAGPDEGGYRGQVESLLQQAGALDRAVFTGMLSGREKLAALGAADVFVLPSYSEVLGISTIEAMACGLPVVISRQCNFPEVAEAGAGLVIDTDAGQVQAALSHLLDHPEAGQEMGYRGQQLVRERYNWGAIAGQMMEFYQGILESCQSPRVPTV